MTKKINFKMGDIVRASNNVVLVTGKSDHKEYPSFAGVVIMAEKEIDEDVVWKVGKYSETWNKAAFKKIRLPISRIIKNYITNR